MDKLIELGNCRKPHGVKGAFSFHLINQINSSLKKGSRIILKPLSQESVILPEGEIFTIQTINFGNKTIVTLKDVNDRNRVEELLPFSIYIQRSELPELEEDNYYLSDLIGLKVCDEDNKEIGEVLEIGTNGIQDILRIKTSEEVIEILLIDNFVKEIDWEENKITIVLPELV